MPHRKLLATLAAAMLTGAMLTGCASSSTTAADDHALMCDKCQTVWVGETRQYGAKFRRYQMKPEMTCPTCDKMAASYFEDGKLVLHECPECKTTPRAYEMKHTGHKHQ